MKGILLDTHILLKSASGNLPKAVIDRLKNETPTASFERPKAVIVGPAQIVNDSPAST